MNIDVAVNVAGRYVEVLEEMKTLLFPASVLPFHKRHIKTALRTCLLAAGTAEVPDTLKDTLETGYLALAYFVDDDKAKLISRIETDALRWYEELKPGRKLSTLLKDTGKNTVSNVEKSDSAREVYEEVVREEVKLLQELTGFMKYYKPE